MKTIYLCGAINGCSDSQCKDWREYVKQKLEGKFNFLDPMRRDYRGKEKENVNEIVIGDYEDIDNSNIILVNGNNPSWGTAMEVHQAYSNYRITNRPKEILVVCDKESPSPWLVYHSNKIFKDIEDALEYLKNG